jgi:predicted ATPase
VPEFKAGVFWVGLAALREPALVMETIAQTLGAKEELASHIGQRQLLLLLDNLEQVIDAAPTLSQLLSACPQLQLLVTSRELLRVQGEVDYPVPPLVQSEAVELFCARTRLEPDDDIAELCGCLDHLPLAVELAAARTNVLSPAQILERLSQRLDMLKGGRDADPRQQTLRATIEWSYDLLSPEERQLFARLSVFAGGCTLESAVDIAEAGLDTLQALVEKSLVRHMDDRFSMLETMREFALERLQEAGGADDLERRHARFYLALAEEFERHLRRQDEAIWLGRLDREHDNMRAAISSSLRREDAEIALRLTGALHNYWYRRGYLLEGRRWAELALALPGSTMPRLREKALGAAGELALESGDLTAARRFLDEHVPLCEALGDPIPLAAIHPPWPPGGRGGRQPASERLVRAKLPARAGDICACGVAHGRSSTPEPRLGHVSEW